MGKSEKNEARVGIGTLSPLLLGVDASPPSGQLAVDASRLIFTTLEFSGKRLRAAPGFI